MRENEKTDILSQALYLPRVIWRTLKLFLSPTTRGKMLEMLGRMRKEGVNVEDQAQRRAWIRRHRAELSRAVPGAYAAPQPSWNDHCPCGSRKKYKRYCGALSARLSAGGGHSRRG